MPDDWSTLRYSAAENGWTGRIALKFLGGCSVKWSLEPNGIEGPLDAESDATAQERGGVPLVVRSADVADPSAAQRRAFDFLLAQQAKVGKAVLMFLLSEARETLFEQTLPSPEECSAAERQAIRRFGTLAGFRELVELTGATIRAEDKAGTAYVVFDFNSALDEEHGFSVLAHRDQPLTFGSSGEDGGGVPADDASPSIDWSALVNDASGYLMLLKTIKNTATATAALDRLEAAHSAYQRAASAVMDLQDSIVGKEAIWSSPHGPKFFRLTSSISDQYLRLGKKDDVVALLEEKLGSDHAWRRCVELAQQYR